MAPKKKGGRAAAEAAFAALMKQQTTMVGDVGEGWEKFAASLAETDRLREEYETARAAAVKSGAVTNDQLDQMGYKRAPKLPTLPTGSAGADNHKANSGGASAHSGATSQSSNHETSGAGSLAPHENSPTLVGGHNGEHH